MTKRNARRLFTLAVLATIPSFGVMPFPAASAIADAPELVRDPLTHVDPMIGTGVATGFVGEINNFPGPTMPFGMVQLSPDTPGAYAGYRYSHDHIRGFSLTHASAGCPIFGDVPILPVVGAVGPTPWSRAEPFAHSDEHAEVGRYTVKLGDPKVGVQLSATTRAGGLTFAFPARGAAHVIVKSDGSLAKVSHAAVQITGARTVTGSVTTGGFCDKGNSQTIYYAIEFDHDFGGFGTWQATALRPNTRAASDLHAGAWLTFAPGATIKAKVAISYVDVAGAQANLAAELPGWDFDAARDANRAAWRALLGRIAVAGRDPPDLTMFYTSFYQSFVHPNTANDVDGRYLGFDGVVHHVERGRMQYTNFSDWDTYRSLGALHALIAPKQASDMAQSLVNDAVEGGSLPRWPLANQYTGQMTGDSPTPLIASMYAFGARTFDTATALNYMRRGATQATPAHGGFIERPGIGTYLKLGYGPQTEAFRGDHQIVGASVTLEWSVDDFAIGEFAAALGDTGTAREYRKRSGYWRNVFDPAAKIMAARNVDGSFSHQPAGAGFGQPGFDEGTAEQYTWMVPHNMAGLIAALGGRNAAAERLDRFVQKTNVGPNEPYLWIGNEPNFNVPWIYNYLGRPWRTTELIDTLNATLFKPVPNGKPGNDDLGAQAAWYVWAAMGLYPATPGTNVIALNTPRFDRVALMLGNGKRLELRAPGASKGRRYITSLHVNDLPWDRTYLPERIVADGGVVDMRLAAQPNHRWGTAPLAAPPSYPSR